MHYYMLQPTSNLQWSALVKQTQLSTPGFVNCPLYLSIINIICISYKEEMALKCTACACTDPRRTQLASYCLKCDAKMLVSYILEARCSLKKTRDAVSVLHWCSWCPTFGVCDLQGNVGRQLHQYPIPHSNSAVMIMNSADDYSIRSITFAFKAPFPSPL
jgi:hypothetical protein